MLHLKRQQYYSSIYNLIHYGLHITITMLYLIDLLVMVLPTVGIEIIQHLQYGCLLKALSKQMILMQNGVILIDSVVLQQLVKMVSILDLHILNQAYHHLLLQVILFHLKTQTINTLGLWTHRKEIQKKVFGYGSLYKLFIQISLLLVGQNLSV